jgi:FkbM family methyltransferase
VIETRGYNDYFEKHSVISYISRAKGFLAFGVVGKPPYSKFFRLLPDGRVGGYINPNESRWNLENGSLVVTDSSGQTTTIFDRVETDANGKFLLVGKFVFEPNSGIEHYLQPIIDPYHIATEPKNFNIDKHFLGQRRRNLVIMGANEESMHHGWERNIADHERNWDLCISFYGKAQNYPPPGPVEYTSLQTGVRKWLAIHAAMYEGSPFWDYERIFVLDDDIRTTWKDINEFLDICREHDLWLAQPSLAPNCCITHSITEQQPGSLIRFTDFVEAMAPCFTNEALRECISITQGGYYGFGIDHLWPLILGLPKDKIGIVDAVAIEHTRPLGTNYPINLAKDEEKALFEQYKVSGGAGLNVVGYVRMNNVEEMELAKVVLVDVGASGGIQEKWTNLADRIRPVMFEPNTAEAAKLRTDLVKYPGAVVLEIGLSDRIGSRKINITEHYGCVSLLQPNYSFLKDYSIAPLFEVKQVLEIECTRYDILFSQNNVPAPDVIKIDVQGYEYEVLKGFGDLLNDCIAIELEAHFYELYEKQHLFGDLVKLLMEHNFVLRAVYPVDHFDGDCVEIDAVFTKNRPYMKSAKPAIREKFDVITKILNLPPF